MKKLLGLLVLSLSFINAEAQNDETILKMWYGEIKNTDVAEHLELEKAYFTKFHKQRIANGDIIGWDMWEIINPEINAMTTTYIYVSLVKDFETIGKNTPIEGLEGVSKEDWEAGLEKAMSHYIRTYEVTTSIKGSYGTQEENGPSNYAVINYMEVDPYQTAAYEKMELETFLPMFKDQKIRNGWALHKILNHFGSEKPINYITADFYSSLQPIYESRNGAIAMNEADTKFWKSIDAIRTLKKSHILRKVLSVR